MNKDESTIAVLFGGFTHERTMSETCAADLLRSLDGRMIKASGIEVKNRRLPEQLLDLGPTCAIVSGFGPYFEDGGIQHDLKEAGIPYIGPSSGTARQLYDKSLFRKNVSFTKVPQPRFLRTWENQTDVLRWCDREDISSVMLKPTNGGSSKGISRILKDQLASEVRILETSTDMIIEEFIPLRSEYTTTVRCKEGNLIKAYSGRIVYEGRWFDETIKLRGAWELLPLDHRSETHAQLGMHAKQLCAAFQATGFIRFDWAVDVEGTAYVLECDVVTPLGPRSISGRLFASAGDDLIQNLIAAIDELY